MAEPSGYRRRRVLAAGLALAFLAVPVARAAGDSAPVPGATVDGLLALVRKLNPDLAAAALDREAAVAEITPAGALEDPMLNVTRDQGFRQTMATVSQTFPLWGKRGLRTDVATADADAARGREGDVARRLEERVKVTFADYYEAEEAIKVTEDIGALLDTVSATARARYRQGTGGQSDALRAALERTRLETKLAALRQAVEAAKAKINALIGRPATARLAKPAALPGVPAADTLSFNALVARARQSNPMLAAARAEIAAAQGERRLVDKSWYPDLTVTAGIDELPGMSPQPVVGIGIKVPLQWGVRDAQAHAATAKQSAAQSRLDSGLLGIESDLREALTQLQHADHVRDLLTTSLAPQSEAAYQSAVASYQLGRGDLTSILDAARQRLEIRLDLLRTDTEAQMAFAAIQRLVGDDL